MKLTIATIAAAAVLWFSPTPVQAEPFVHRPHYIHERQIIPERKTNYETYYLRKYGRLPPFTRVYDVPMQPVLPPGYQWSNNYVPGYGYVPPAPILD